MSTVMITFEDMAQNVPQCLEMFSEAGFDVRYPKNDQLPWGRCSEQETIQELRGAEAVMAALETYSETVLAGLPDLRVIARVGVGVDAVDIKAATARGVAVAITPTANHEAVAEHALAFLLATSKSLGLRTRGLVDGRWDRGASEPVRTSTLGILGLGRIGRSLALRARALEMRVIAAEKYPDREFVRRHGIELVEFDTLLARSDHLSLHCPLTDETRGLFNRTTFAKMKSGSVLINTARGGLVLESDLVEALQSGHLRGACLDVFEQEPSNPLFRLDQVFLSPHVAGVDHLSFEATAVEAAKNIIRLSRDRWPDGAIVNDQLKENWKW